MAKRKRKKKRELSDREILQIVDDAIELAEEDGEHWASYVDVQLVAAGVAVADVQPDGTDPWEVVFLRDGRAVYLSDESAEGPDRYRIT